jgi:hypothetical protein
MASVRLCVCGKEISRFRRASTTECDKCKAAKKTKVLKEEGLVLVHSCLADAKHDQYVLGCICRKTVTKEESLDLIKCGDAISLATREYVFDGGPIIYINGHSKTPRAPTIEAGHMIRGVGSMSPSSKKRRTGTRSIEELIKLREEERASIAEEARTRWEEYHRLNQDWMSSVTKEYSDSEFYAYDRENWGRGWSTQPGGEDQRTAGGIGIEGSRSGK